MTDHSSDPAPATPTLRRVWRVVWDDMTNLPVQLGTRKQADNFLSMLDRAPDARIQSRLVTEWEDET